MDFDFKKALWIIPAEKRKTRRTKPSVRAVRLTQDLVGRLDRLRGTLPEGANGSSRPSARAASGVWGSAEHQAVREKTGLADLRAHDLGRRALGFAGETVDAVLGHREGRVAQTYQVYDHAAEKTAALKAWERELARVLAGRWKGSRDVLAFARRTAGS